MTLGLGLDFDAWRIGLGEGGVREESWLVRVEHGEAIRNRGLSS